MIRIPVYLFPMLMDFVLSGILFISAYRFSAAAVAPWIVGASMAAWSLIYSILALAAGKIVKPERSHLALIGSGILIALAAFGFIVFDGLYTQFVWLGLSGVAMAFFFTPFQMYMKLLEPQQNNNQGIIRPSALYLAAWSFGFAVGPIVFGFLAPLTGFLICTAGGAVITFGVLALEKYRCSRTPVQKTETEPEPAAAPDGSDAVTARPDLVWIGWLLGGAGCLAIAVVRTMGPFRGVQVLGLTKEQVGIALSCLSFLQCFTGLLLIFSKDWIYRRIPCALVSAAGIASLLTFALCSGFSGFVIASLLFGIYSGCYYFLFVCHSLAHPTKSGFYISINESIVGATGVISPVLGGALISRTNCHWIFIAAAAAVIISFAIQLIIFHKKGVNQ